MPQSASPDTIIEQYWDRFFVDDFSSAIKLAEDFIALANSEEELKLGYELKAKILLKQGLFEEARLILEQAQGYSGLKLFVHFLTTGDIESVISEFKKDDLDSQVYKAQSIILSNIYWGPSHISSNPSYEEPDLILEEVFNALVEANDFDRAILNYAQLIELLYKEQEFAKDIVLPIVSEQVNNLLSLSSKAKYSSVKARIYLLKAKLFKDKQAAEDAEILFGKENNFNGLAEVYAFYAIECNEEEYSDKALKIFIRLENHNAQGFIYESLASNLLMKGAIQEACSCFDKAEKELGRGGFFEKLGLRIQRLSLHAVKGEFQEIQDEAHDLIAPQIPKLFRAQACQILATTLLHIDQDIEETKELILIACDYFQELKKFNQLLNAKNIYFQIISLNGDLEDITTLGEEIVQLADRLSQPEAKATKYTDLAFAIVRHKIQDKDFDEGYIETASDYFKKATEIYQALGNLSGEADVYQAMGNMFTNIGKPEESYKSFNKACKLYEQDGNMLQAAVTGTLIGILMLDVVVLNEHTYQIAHDNLHKAFEYYRKEGLLDLVWKNAYYLASLNEKMLRKTGEENFKTKTGYYYAEMYEAANKYEEKSSDTVLQLVGMSIEDAFADAERFFKQIGENEIADKFKR